VYEELISVDSLPPMSATASRLLAMASDPDVEIEALAATIAQDPPLTAKVLGIANSAYYAPRRPVLTVKDAIIRVLGLRMVRNLSLGLALSGPIDSVNCERFDPTRYWILALGTADLAGGLARAATVVDGPDPDAVYLVGLLHNLGELLLVHLRPYEMNQILGELAERPEQDPVEIERAAFGIDRWGAGALLARHWELPAVVGDSIEQMATANSSSDMSPMVYLLSAARCWIEGVVAGGSDPLTVVGVDEAYCENRSASFVEGFAALKTIATSLRN
jgi:HD-like signal output (HDOD) protein